MIFLDSWVWLEYLFDGEAAEAAESGIREANDPDVGGLIAPTVVAEVSYRVAVVEDAATAAEAVAAIRSFDHVDCVPLVDEIGAYAADLRYRYYQRGTCELSYADAFHLAVATLHESCDTLLTGDPDFESVDEVETVVL